MFKTAIASLVVLLTLTQCSESIADQQRDLDETARQEARTVDNKRIADEILTKGIARVGTTPDGKPLYMKEINNGWSYDRVFFTGTTIGASESCGKNCDTTVTLVK